MTAHSQADVVGYPDPDALTTGLTAVLKQRGIVNEPVVVLDRKPNVHASTFPSEIVTCRVAGESELRLLCKYYDETSYRDAGHGHRGGVAYEAQVYRHILEPSCMSLAQFYGAYSDPVNGGRWLVIKYLENSMSVSRFPQPDAMVKAARWIGEFHAVYEAQPAKSKEAMLIQYDSEYYAGWARRTAQYARSWHNRFPWVGSLCSDFEKLIPVLLSASQPIIHGEYYPKNILVSDDNIYPVDWESAALAVGEIDLATLIDGWPEDILNACKREYQHSRWPSGAPLSFNTIFDASRIYVQMRWLGDWEDFTASNALVWRFEHLRSLGERMKLI